MKREDFLRKVAIINSIRVVMALLCHDDYFIDGSFHGGETEEYTWAVVSCGKRNLHLNQRTRTTWDLEEFANCIQHGEEIKTSELTVAIGKWLNEARKL